MNDHPVPVSDPKLPPPEPGEPRAAGGAPAAGPDQRISILLVDDEPKNLTVLETILDDPGYRLVRAESADQALLALVAEEFALIVLDIQMPGMSGFELAQLIKQRKKTAGVPIIFLTAYYSEDQHILEGYGTGAVDYLHKPVNSRILRSKVAVFAELHRKTRECTLANHALLAEVIERRRVQGELRQWNMELERRVQERTAELLAAITALRESEERLRLAQQAGKIGIWDWDLATGAGTWTDAAWEIFDPAGKGDDVTMTKWLTCIHPDDRERADLAVHTPISAGRYRDEYRVVTQDARTKWVESVGAFEYEGTRPVRMLGAVRDITERKEMELELKESSRRKDEFLAMLGHELRNPLAPIRSGLDLLRMEQPGSDIIGLMKGQVDHLVRLVDDLLDVSRIMRGKIEFRREPVELATVIAQAVETARPIIEGECHQLTRSLPLSPVWLDADSVRLTQVFANLLNNSAKYTPNRGHISITAHVEGQMVVVHIRDDGVGIEPELLPLVFDLFTQGDRAIDRSQGGLGIGLTVVKSLVEMHRGTVTAHSAGTGLGSEFIVRLPILTQQRIEPAQRLAHRPQRGYRILAVDDNVAAATLLKLLLSKLGPHEITVAHDGPSTLESVVNQRPEIVLLDIGLPGMSGYEVAARMRALPENAGILLVALTGYGSAEDRRESRAAGFDEHLVKPADIEVLRRLMDHPKLMKGEV